MRCKSEKMRATKKVDEIEFGESDKPKKLCLRATKSESDKKDESEG